MESSQKLSCLCRKNLRLAPCGAVFVKERLFRVEFNLRVILPTYLEISVLLPTWLNKPENCNAVTNLRYQY